MKILFCSSEVVPFAKTGGLADVSAALPPALKRQGSQVKVALPKYGSIKPSIPLRQVAGAQAKATKMEGGIDVYLIENAEYFDRPQLYGEAGTDYPDNLERFAFFCKETLSLLKAIDFQPDIIHCNDWQTALIPAYLRTTLLNEPFFKRTKAIFTIHNLAYQGLFPKAQFVQTGLDQQLFNMHALEFYGKANLLKGGLVFSRFISTVSPTYAREIQTREFGCGLEGVLKERKKDLVGIINGLDYASWDPAVDDKIFQRYTADNLQDKYLNKQRLQQQLNLPCAGDASQKGIELIISGLNEMAKLNLQFVLLGTGDQKYHLQLEQFKQKGFKNISINLGFDLTLARNIYAGCDMFLMPSQYEPCGLGQLICLKYGTIPIVRKTGGLADTVVDEQADKSKGNGFVFEKYASSEMLKAISRAMALYKTKDSWRRLILKAMSCDFSWEASARKYIELYQRALEKG
jgi:starch synthase